MKYWIVIDSWNLMETFTTESLSPHIFYLKRAFGNDLTRYISKNGELFNNLVLYKEEPVSYTHLDVYKRQAIKGNNPIANNKMPAQP